MTNIEIGKRIKYARDLRKATLEDVAQKVGVTKSTIQRYENGKINAIKIPVVESIAIALNVNPSWIVGKSDNMELPSQKTTQIIQYYEMLNDDGKQEATKRVKELTYIPLYRKNNTLINKHNEIEISEEIQISSHPHFTNVQKAKEYLKQRSCLAAFQFNQKEPTDSDILTMANTLWITSDKE